MGPRSPFGLADEEERATVQVMDDRIFGLRPPQEPSAVAVRRVYYQLPGFKAPTNFSQSVI